MNNGSDISFQASRAAQTRTTVFVVDDDATICKAIERLLRSAGHAVETFSSAEAFLARDPLPSSGTLLLDVRMPGMNGPELQAHLAAAGAELDIYFVSSVDDPRVRGSALSAGARGWFAKPLDGEALLEALGAAGGDRPGGVQPP